MNKTFLSNAFLGSAEFLAAPPAARGHWVGLQRYCSERENGGVLKGARAFSATQWSMVVGVGGGVRAIDRLVGAGLARWAGDDLVVGGYDLDSERAYQDRRVRASAGGRAKAARERERREQPDEADIGGVTSSGSSGSAAASASADQRGGPEGWEGDRDAEGRGAEVWRGAQGAPRSVPRTSDEMVRLFGVLHQECLGRGYQPTAADTMSARAEWAALEPTELPERIGTYLRTRGLGQSSISGFLGWYPGPAAETVREGRGGR